MTPTKASRPVFVWRADRRTSTQGPHCRYCSFYIKGPNLEAADLSLLDDYRAAAAEQWNDPLWTGIATLSVGDTPPWEAYVLECPRCGWWARGVTNHSPDSF